MRYKAIILDFDDTLYKLDVDWQRLKEDVSGIVGVRYSEKRGIFQTIDKKNNPKLKEKAYGKITQREIKGAEFGSFMPQAKKFLRMCQKENIKTALVSRNSRKSILYAFEKEAISFSGPIIGRGDVKKLKPNPEGINRALKTLGISKKRTLYIGNSEYSDKKAAERAGVDFLLFTSWEEVWNKLLKLSLVRISQTQF